MKKYKYYAKRGLALLIALVMCMGMLPLAAFAEEGETAPDEQEIVAQEVTEPAGVETQDPAEVVEPAETEKPVEVEEPAEEKTTAVEEVRVEAAAPQMAATQAEEPVAEAMPLSLMPVTAHAASYDYDNRVFLLNTTTVEGKYQSTTSEWAKLYKSTLEGLHYTVTPSDGQWQDAQMAQFSGDTVDLWVWSDDMKADGVESNQNKIPYFYVKQNGEVIGKWRLEKIEVHAGNGVYQDSQFKGEVPLTIAATESSYSINKSTLDSYRDGPYYGDPVGTGFVAVVYVWEYVKVDDSDPDKEIPKPTSYKVNYTLNKAVAPQEGQLPNTVKVKGGNSVWIDDKGLDKKTSVLAEGAFDLYPIDKIYTSFSAEGYDLIGWKCEDNSCTVCAGGNAIFHKIGENVEATAARAGEDDIITLTAQWKKWVLPSLEDIGKLDLSNDPPMLMLATVNSKGEMVKITQHSAETGAPVTDELMLDPSTGEIYYEATVQMNSVAASLKAYITSPDFARFKITVKMAEQLKLAGIDEDGMVEFTFTCPFLEPVPGNEVLVDGQAVSGVTVNRDKSPYIYKVPASSLTREDGTIKQFSFLVQWRSTTTNGNLYSGAELSAPMTLKTAKAIATSKAPFETTGSVAGWINPKGNLPYNLAQEKALALAMLSNSPTLKKYLQDLSNDQATSVMLDYLASKDGQDASMSREILPANKLTAYIPCIVTFNSNGGTAVAAQNIKQGRTATQPTAPTREGYIFTGWNLGDAAYNFNTPVTDDITLTAQWTVSTLPTPTMTITPSATSLTGGGTVTLTVSGPAGTTVSASPSVTLTNNGNGTYTVTLPNSTQTYTFTASFPGNDAYAAASASCTVAVTYRSTGGGSSSGGGTYRPSTGGGGGGGTTTIIDPEVPLAGGLQLNREDHFAYVSGYQDGTVCPVKNITREEVAVIFYQLLTDSSKLLYGVDENDFSDVETGRWSNRAISTLANAGVISGYPDGTFRPGQTITRAEFAAIASRFDEVTEGLRNPFSDTAGHWAENVISYAASKGWVSGYPDGTFQPQKMITRAEAMTMVNNVLDREVDEEGLLASAKQWPDNQKGSWYYYEVLEATNSHDYARRSEGSLVENWTAITDK